MVIVSVGVIGAGLMGSGRTELAETLFGLSPADGGEILIKGEPVRIESPSHAIELGIGYVPEDRRQHGVVLDMSIAANTSLASLDRAMKEEFTGPVGSRYPAPVVSLKKIETSTK